MNQVLVTGGSGYVGAQLIAAPLRARRRVRATVRSTAREADLRAAARRGAMPTTPASRQAGAEGAHGRKSGDGRGDQGRCQAGERRCPGAADGEGQAAAPSVQKARRRLAPPKS